MLSEFAGASHSLSRSILINPYNIEQTADAIMITDKQGTIEYINPAFEKMTGYNAEELLEKTFQDITHKHDSKKKGEMKIIMLTI